MAAVWFALCALTGPAGDFPLNDDWVYGLAVRSVLETGRFALPSPAAANVFAQAYWGALFCLPFGFSFTAIRLSTIVLGLAGVVSLHLLLRELGATRATALFGALTLAVNPLYVELSETFMTDVPFLALFTASLWLHARGVRRGSAAAAALAFLAALAAILIRQFALVLPAAFAVAHVMRGGARPRVWIVAAIPVLAALMLHLGYERWLLATGRTAALQASLTGLIVPGPLASAGRMFRLVLEAAPYPGLFAAPMLLLAAAPDARGRRRRSGVLFAVLFGAIYLVGVLVSGSLMGGLGNLLTPYGLGPLTLRDTYLLNQNLPAVSAAARSLWVASLALGAMATALLCGAALGFAPALLAVFRDAAAGRRIWAPATMLFTAVAYLAGMFVLGLNAPLFDRYLLPVLIPAAGLLVTARQPGDPRAASARPTCARPTCARPICAPQWRTVARGVLLAVYAAFAVAGTHDYLAWNRARWRATAALTRAGISPRDIDGGYEFNGWYLNDPAYRETRDKSYWWVDGDAYVIASGPLAGYRPILRYAVDRWLGTGPSAVVVLRRAAAPD